MAFGQPVGGRFWRGWGCALLAAVSMWSAAGSSQAVNIKLSYQSGDSAPPSWDPSGTALKEIMEAAEAIWEDIIEDSWSLEIEYYWSNLSGTTLGLHTNLKTDSWAGDRRPQKARIQLDSRDGGVDQAWYNDTTPFDHSEYDMVQHLVLGDPAANYYSDPPELVEAGYRGAAMGTAPADAQNNMDLLSVCLHEMGHALGMTDRVAEDDVGVYAYVFPSDMVDHQYSGVDVFNTSDVYHLEPPNALMFPTSSTGMRTLPSATDVMAIARCSDWTSIDLPRQDLWGPYDMNAGDSWEGGKVPDADDDGYVRFGIYNDPADSDTAHMTGDIRVENLYISNGSSVETNSHTLTVDETLEINQAPTGGKPTLIVNSGGTLDGKWVNVGGGELRLAGGFVDVVGIETESLNGAVPSITGYGTVEATRLDNDGEVRAFPGGLLRIVWPGVGMGLDLDGDAESGQVDASYGDVEIAGGGIVESFSGTMMIGTTGNSTVRYVDVTTDWTLGFGAQLTLVGNSDGSFTRRAELRGGQMTVDGTVSAAHDARIDAMTEFNNASEIVIAESGVLYLGATRTDAIKFHGVAITGLGKLVQNGNTNAGQNTAIDVATYDMDGTTVSDMTCYGTVSVTSDHLNDDYSGHLTVNGQLSMDLGVDPTWTADTGSTITIGRDGSIDGSTKLVLQGTLESGNENRVGTINSALDITSSATVEVVAANDVLDLAGPTMWYGPTRVAGGGTLAQTGDSEVMATTTIDTYFFDFDGSDENSLARVHEGVTFTINSQGLEKDVSGGRYDGTVHVDGGTLAVNTNGPWDLGGTVYLTGTGGTTSTLDGQPVCVDGGLISVKGAAIIDTAVTLVGSGLTVGGGSTLIHSGPLSVDGGELYIASAGKIDVNGNAYFRVGGTTRVDGELELNGPVNFYGGTFIGNGLLQIDTPSTIAALILSPTTIDVARFDLDGTSGNTRTELEDDLTLNVDGLDVSDSAFNGAITIYDDSTLTVNLPGGAAWPMMGDLKVFDPGAWGVVSLAGSTMNVTGGGTVDVDAHTRFDAKINVHSTGTVVLQNYATLELGGGTLAEANRMLGGVVANADELNPGTLAAGSGKALVGYGTVGSDINFSGDSAIMAEGGTLTLRGTLLDLGGKIGTADADGTLHVITPWNTALADSCELNGGRIEGAQITNDGKIVGHGEIASAGLVNNGHLVALGGDLIIDTPIAPDFDGSGTEDGVIDATRGSVHSRYNGFTGSYAFNGELLIGPGQFFRMDSGFLSNMGTADNEGRIIMTGGRYIADRLYQDSTLKVLADTATLDADASFAPGSNTTLDADLQLLHSSIVQSGASITGSAALINDATGRIDLDDGSDVDAHIVNRGTMYVGITTTTQIPAAASARQFTQTASGTLAVDLLGTMPGSEYDQLTVTGPVALAGEIILMGPLKYCPVGEPVANER